MRVLVTGAAGFLGSHVADAFAEAGHDVLVYDVAPTTRHPRVTGDLMDVDALRVAMRGREVVCHLAAIGDVYLAGERPALAAAVNVTGTANVCEAALAEGLRVVAASTWEVYGEPERQPIEEGDACRPDHPYNITKYAGERLALSYAHLKGLHVVALRLGTAYGTRMRPNSVFSVFIDRALRGEPITVHGDGAQGRQFTHASDVGRAFLAAAERAASGSVYNVVAERIVTIRQLAELVVGQLPTTLTFGPPRQGDVPSARVSAERAARELQWAATVRFEDGVAEIIEERRAAIRR
jgi:UDP-glucose 4-epimerase